MNTGLIDTLETAFHPKAIAVAGASETPVSFGYHFMRHLLDYGYPGHIYPVNPDKETILGLKAYPDLSSIPETVDYVICCLPAPKVLDLLPQCRSREVRVVHLLAARLSETGRQEAKDLEAKILQVARSLNIRLIGPNCMGLYYPRGGLAHGYDLPKEPGTIGCVFQSGGSSALLVRYGELRGLRFSKVISYGNALDLDESDFLYYLARDAETKIIAAYFEGVKDGRKFLKALSDAASVKPVIAIKGGRGLAGAKAAASHTAAIAGSDVIWRTAFKKAGVVPVRDLSELVDLLVAFYFLPTITGNRVGIVSAGGGLTVMAADACEEAGLAVPPLPNDLREELKIKAPEIWDWLGNPIDGSAVATVSTGFPETLMEITRMMASSPNFDFVIAEYTDDNPFQEQVWSSIGKSQTEAFINLFKSNLKPLIAVVTAGVVSPNRLLHQRWNMLTEQRMRFVDAHIPTYSTVAEAAKAVRKFIGYCKAKAQA